MKQSLVALILAAAMCAAACAGAQSADNARVNLTSFARITASDTRDTFLTLWPRETTDAPYTVRDNDLATAWKTVPKGEQVLTLDFAPLLPAAPTIRELTGVWTVRPLGLVIAKIFTFCGGEPVAQYNWEFLGDPLVIEGGATGYCVEITAIDPGPAALAEVGVYAAAPATPPSIGEVAVETSADAVRVAWSDFGETTNRVEIHYVPTGSDDLDGASRIASVHPARAWEGPLPANDGYDAVVVPVAADGSYGEAQRVAFPARSTALKMGSGAVEGFYGHPWSHEERRRMAVRLARTGLGLLIYAPKNDSLHRDDWRIFYDEDALAQFAEVRSLAARLGVTFSLGISPGKDLQFENPQDTQRLVDKLAPFVERGFRHFTILFDDIELGAEGVPVGAELGELHRDLTNWLIGELSEAAGEAVTLWFVPTVYSTKHVNEHAEGAGYLQALYDLDPSVTIMWTGPNVFSKTLTPSDLVDVTAWTGRRPAIWENMHATDGGDAFTGKVYLAPYQGRPATLPSAVAGIVANPMILGSPDRLLMGTYSAYLKDPFECDPHAAMERSAALESPDDHDRDLLERMARTYYGSAAIGNRGVNPPRNPAMDDAIDAFREVYETGSSVQIARAGADLLAIAAHMATAQGRLHHSGIDAGLVDDLFVPSERLTHEGRALLSLLSYVGTEMQQLPAPYRMEETQAHLRLALGVRYQLSLFKVNLFRSFVERTQVSGLRFAAPAISAPDTDLMIGELWEYLPAPGKETTLSGLPGARRERNTWRWTPDHAGVYQAIVTAADNNGFASREFFVTVSDDVYEPPAEEGDEGGDDDDDEGCGS